MLAQRKFNLEHVMGLTHTVLFMPSIPNLEQA